MRVMRYILRGNLNILYVIHSRPVDFVMVKARKSRTINRIPKLFKNKTNNSKTCLDDRKDLEGLLCKFLKDTNEPVWSYCDFDIFALTITKSIGLASSPSLNRI